MSMNHPTDKHDGRAEENQKKRKSYKKGRYKITRDGKNSTGNGKSGKSLTLSSQTQSALFTDCGMSQADISK